MSTLQTHGTCYLIMRSLQLHDKEEKGRKMLKPVHMGFADEDENGERSLAFDKATIASPGVIIV